MKYPRHINIFIVILISLLLIPPIYHQVTFGYFLQIDYYYFISSIILAILLLLPSIIKINALVFLTTVFVIELGFWCGSVFIGNPENPKNAIYTIRLSPEGNKVSNKDIATDNDVMGYKPIPDICYKIDKELNRKKVFSAKYCIDDVSRRITPIDDSTTRDMHLLAFGGSYTFGTGVNDNETWVFHLAKIAAHLRPYNYAYRGYGPQHMLAKLQSTELNKQVTEARGIALYYFIDDHIKRVMNTLKTRWTHRSPHYELDSDERLVYRGLFNDAHPFLYSLYHEVLLHSHAIQMLPFDIPPKITANDIKTTCAIILAARDEYLEQFGNGKFYVVFSPAGEISQSRESLGNCLKENHVQILDYSKIAWPEIYRIWGDGHPRPEAYKEIAKLIGKDLDL